MNELIHAALPFALRPAGGKACAFSVDEEGTPSLSGEARSDVLIARGGHPAGSPIRHGLSFSLCGSGRGALPNYGWAVARISVCTAGPQGRRERENGGLSEIFGAYLDRAGSGHGDLAAGRAGTPLQAPLLPLFAALPTRASERAGQGPGARRAA